MKRFLQGLSGPTSPFVGKTYRFGRLECIVEDQIAEGGFSLVFVVRANNGSHYALKRISVNNRKDLAIGKLEISIMKKLSCHKNIITYIDSSITEVNPGIFELLILMEYCRDGHVIQLMNENLNNGLGEDLILRIFTDVCEAVATLHHSQPPVTHRDLKVENILRNAKGDFVLCDYGSASTTPINPKESKLSEVEEEIQRFTTLSYRAPEMVDLYSGKIIDMRSDIWALGCLLYKLCFFTVPFGESVLAIQNGQFTIPENSRYSKEMHSLIRYILEPDPDIRPDIYQVASVAFQLRKKSCPVLNHLSSDAPKQLPEDNSKLSSAGKSKVARSVHEPVSTSLKPRDRPRAGVAPLTTPATSSAAESSTLLQQTQAFHQAPPHRHSPPVQHTRPAGNHPAYLNPFGERPSRDPSPVGKRFVDREFTHTRSRSDPVFVHPTASQDGAPHYVTANQCPVPQHVTANQNFGPQHMTTNQTRVTHHVTQQQQHMNAPQITYGQHDTAPNFPKWNPFSNDFVLNTETTDDDFASLRESTDQQSVARVAEPTVQHGQQRPVEPVVQQGHRNTGQVYGQPFLGGNVQGRYAQQPSNSSLSTQRSSNNSNVSPYASDSSRRSSDCEDDVIMAQPIVRPHAESIFGGQRKHDAFLDGPVNAGCDIDEMMITRFDQSTALNDPSRGQSGHANDTSGVFDSAPFRKPAKPVVKTPSAPPVSARQDPFGAVPFKQKEAAKLVRRQARRSNKEGGEARRVLPTVPTQVRR